MPENQIAPFEGTSQEGFASNGQSFENLALLLAVCSNRCRAMMMGSMEGYVEDFAD